MKSWVWKLVSIVFFLTEILIAGNAISYVLYNILFGIVVIPVIVFSSMTAIRFWRIGGEKETENWIDFVALILRATPSRQ